MKICFSRFCLNSSFLLILLTTAGCGGGGQAASESGSAAAPSISAISPAAIPAGSSAFKLTVTGSGFVAGSVVVENGTPLATTFVSRTELDSTVSTSLVAAAGNIAISVVNPDGQTSASGGAGAGSMTLAVTNGTPTISGLAPSTAVASAAATTVTITGTGFVAGSKALFQGSARPTEFKSSTELTITLNAGDLATPGAAAITVTNPPPGGGSSNASSFTIAQQTPTPPMLSSLSPSSAIVGSGPLLLSASGAAFLPSSVIYVNDQAQPTQYVSSAELTTTLTANTLAYTGPLEVRVTDPVAGSSSSLTLQVVNPVPVVTSLTPAAVTAGGPEFQLLINGSNFQQTSQVLVNGTPRPTFASSTTFLPVEITSADIATTGSVEISVVNPTPGGGISSAANLQVIAAANRLHTVDVLANDLAWDSKQQRIYASVPASSAKYGSSIVAIDPKSGTVVASQQLTSEPEQLSLTNDQQYLYVSLPSIGAIARLALPSLTPDIQWTLGTAPDGSIYRAADLEAAPGNAHTVAVTRGSFGLGQNASGGLAIYDDGKARPIIATNTDWLVTYDRVQWGADATVLYATNGTSSGGPEYTFAVSASGPTLTNNQRGVLGDFAKTFIYDRSTARLYDGYGTVADPTTGKMVGMYSAINTLSYEPNEFAVDSMLHRVYILNGNPTAINPTADTGLQIQVFDQDRFTYIDSLVLPGVSGGGRMIRWGSAGLAFISSARIYLLDGPFVAPGAVASSDVGSYADPAPRLNSVNPETVPAGSPDTTITLQGQDFTAATTVMWNSQSLATALISPAQIQATIPASSLTNAVAGPITAANSPGTGVSNSLAFTVLTDLGPGSQMRALNLSGSDLVWSGSSNLLYVAVPDSDPVNGNSLAAVDPVSGTLQSAIPIASEPNVLALSGDDQYLYAGFKRNAVVQRYTLPALAADIQIPLGVANNDPYAAAGASTSCAFAVDIRVAPAMPHTIAVAQGSGFDADGCGALAVFDDATPRPNSAPGYINPFVADHDYSSISWGTDATSLYSQTFVGLSSQDFYKLSVSPSGVSLDTIYPNVLNLGYRLHFDSGTGYLYSDGGRVTNPADGTAVGDFKASGLMVPDSKLGRAYFLGQTPAQNNYGLNYSSYTIQVYDLNRFTLIKSIVIPNVIGYPSQLARWGDSGLAFVTENGNDTGVNAPGLLYILNGVAAGGSASQAITQRTAEHVQLTWHPRDRSRPNIGGKSAKRE
jgi:hypothetical protein